MLKQKKSFSSLYSTCMPVICLILMGLMHSCEPDFYLPEKKDFGSSAHLRIFNFGGEFGPDRTQLFPGEVRLDFREEFSYLYVNDKLNNTFDTTDVPLRIIPPASSESNEEALDFGKYVLPSATNRGERFINKVAYVDLANIDPYTYRNSKTGTYFPNFYYAKSKAPIIGSTDFGRWANVSSGAVKLKISSLEVTDQTNKTTGKVFSIPSKDITEATINLSSGKVYTGIWGVSKRSSDELPADQEKPERKLVLIEEPSSTIFSENSSYIRFINMTESNLTAFYETPNPNAQFPSLSKFTLYKATEPHPVQAVDVYIRETYTPESITEQPWVDEPDFKPTLATANLKPFDASTANFTPILDLEKVKKTGEALPRIQVFMYPAGAKPSDGIPPVVFIKNLRLLIKGTKLSTTIATFVFAIDNKKFDFNEQYQYRGFIYNFIPQNAYKEFF